MTMRLIDADALERDGWHMSRTVRIDKDTMEWQTRKPTDFPTIEPQRMRGREGGTYIITERKTERVYFHIRVINADTAHHITLLEEYANKRNGISALTAGQI